MTAPAGFLEFFILEASEYVEQLDGLLLGAGASGPDNAAFQRTARALRGTATMAKLASVRRGRRCARAGRPCVAGRRPQLGTASCAAPSSPLSTTSRSCCTRSDRGRRRKMRGLGPGRPNSRSISPARRTRPYRRARRRRPPRPFSRERRRTSRPDSSCSPRVPATSPLPPTC